MNVDVNTYYIYFRKGDQLAREITGGSGSFGSSATGGSGLPTIYHHGIYVGGDKVIHYTDDSKIHRVELHKFKDGQLLRVRYTKSPKPLKSKEVVKKAKDAYTKNDFGSYNKFDKNCEHFATHCKYGKQCSQQVDTFLKHCVAFVVVAVVVVVVAMLIRRR